VICSNPKGWYLLVCTHLGQAYKPMRCRHCAGCQEAKRRKAIARIIHGMGEQDYLVFLTLTTVNREPRMTWPDIMKAWSRLVAWLRRTYGPMEYALVKEEGAGGVRHLHGIVSGWKWVPISDLSREWQRLTGAYRVWIDRVVGRDGVASYVAKYMAKSGLPLRKLLTYSAGWPKLPPTEWLECTDLGNGRPTARAWADVLVDGTLVEWWGRGGRCPCFGVNNLLE